MVGATRDGRRPSRISGPSPTLLTAERKPSRQVTCDRAGARVMTEPGGRLLVEVWQEGRTFALRPADADGGGDEDDDGDECRHQSDENA